MENQQLNVQKYFHKIIQLLLTHHQAHKAKQDEDRKWIHLFKWKFTDDGHLQFIFFRGSERKFSTGFFTSFSCCRPHPTKFIIATSSRAFFTPKQKIYKIPTFADESFISFAHTLNLLRNNEDENEIFLFFSFFNFFFPHENRGFPLDSPIKVQRQYSMDFNDFLRTYCSAKLSRIQLKFQITFIPVNFPQIFLLVHSRENSWRVFDAVNGLRKTKLRTRRTTREESRVICCDVLHRSKLRWDVER